MKKTIPINILKDEDIVWGVSGTLKVEGDSFHKKDIHITSNGDLFVDGVKQIPLDDEKPINIVRVKRDGKLNYKYQIRRDGSKVTISEYGGKLGDPDIVDETASCYLRLMITLRTQQSRVIELQTFSSDADDDTKDAV